MGSVWGIFSRLGFLILAINLAIKESRADTIPYRQLDASMALNLSNYGTDYTNLTNLQRVGELYSKEEGYHYSGFSKSSGELPAGYQGVVSSKSPEKAMQDLANLMGDSRFAQCGNPSSRGCREMRDALESAMQDLNNQLMYTIVRSFAQVVAWMQKLDLGNSQMIALNESLMGSSSSGGLLNGVMLANEAEQQMGEAMDGAYKNIQKVISQRKGVLEAVSEKLSESGTNGGTKIKEEAALLSRMNSLKAEIALKRVLGQLESSLMDIGKQASDMASGWEMDYSETADGYETPRNGSLDALDILQEDAKTSINYAKQSARLITETYKAAGDLMLAIAQGQIKDYRGSAGEMMKQAVYDWKGVLTSSVKDLDRKLLELGSEESQTLTDNDRMRQPKLRGLRDAAVRGFQKARNDLDSEIGPIYDELKQTQISESHQTKYLTELAGDISTLVRDLSSQVSQARGAVVDKKDQLADASDVEIKAITGTAHEGMDSVVSSVTGGIESTAADLTRISSNGNTQAANLGDSGMSGSAALVAQATQGSLQGVDGLADASEAASSSAALSRARLEVAADVIKNTASRTTKNLASALAEGSDAVGEIRLATMNGIESKFVDAAASVPSLDLAIGGIEVANTALNSDIIANKMSAEQSNIDGKNAADAVTDLGNSISESVNSAREFVVASTNSSSLVKDLNAQITAESHIVGSTNSAVSSKFRSVLSASLSDSLSSVNAKTDEYSSALSGDVANLLEVVDEKKEDIQNRTKAVGLQEIMIRKDVARILSDVPNVEESRGTADLESLMGWERNEASLEFADSIKKVESDLSDWLSGQRAKVVEMIRKDLLAGTQSRISDLGGKEVAELTARKDKIQEIWKSKESMLQNLDKAIIDAKSSFNNFNRSDVQSGLSIVADRAHNVTDQLRKDQLDSVARIYAELNNVSASAALMSQNVTDSSLALVDAVTRKIKAEPMLVIGTNANQAALSFKDLISRMEENAWKRHMEIIHQLSQGGQNMMNKMTRAEIQQIEQNLNLTDAEKKVFQVLLGVTGSISQDSLRNDNFWSDLSRRISLKAINLNQSLIDANGKISAGFNALNNSAILNRIGHDNYLNLVIGGADNSLENAYQSLQGALSGDSTSWSADAGKAYSLQSLLNGLSQKSRAKVAKLVADIQDGRISVSDAISQARIIDLNDIQSLDDAVSLLVGTMADYQQGLSKAFAGSSDRLQTASGIINSTVDQIATELAFALEALQTIANNLTDNITQLSINSTFSIGNESQAVANLEQLIQANQTAVTSTLNSITTDVISLESEMKSSAADYDNFIDSVITTENGKASQASLALRNKIFNTPNDASLLEKPVHPHLSDFDAVKRDLRELKSRIKIRNNISLRTKK